MKDMKELFLKLYEEKYGRMLNREIAEDIVEGFAVTDGTDRTTGEKWPYEEAKLMGDKIGVNWEKVSKCEYYVVLNMMYSDFGKTMKKHGLPDSVLGELANDWFTDEDGTPDKTFRYFMDL